MQKIATRIFIGASLVFGVLGVLMVLLFPKDDSQQTSFEAALMKCFMVTVFIILSSFALSVAGKYLDSK